MRDGIKTTKRTLLCLALALAFTGVSDLAWGQRAPFVELGGTREAAGKPRPSKARMMAMAEAFLGTPDSGVWNGPADTFENTAATYDRFGDLLVRYERFHMGLRLLGSAVKLTVEPGGEVSFNFPPRPVAVPANVMPAVPEARAWSIAADALRVDADGTFGKAELALEPQEQGEALLVWYLHASHPEADPTDFVIDARTGGVLSREQGYAEDSVSVQGMGVRRPDPRDSTETPIEVELDTLWHNDDDEYFLVDHTRGGTQVLDMQDGVETKDFHGRTFSQMNLNEWGDGLDWLEGDPTDGPTGQTAAVEALWGAQRTWDMLLNTQGLEGFDGKAEPMLLRVHFRDEAADLYSDAHWDGEYANFGDGLESESWSRTELKTVSHELGHGVWHRNVTDKSRGEARGLNEGHGDITAALTMHYANLGGGGSTIPTNERGRLEHFRSRSINPWSYHNGGDQGLAAYVNGMEFVEEHCQGAAYGHMFAILAMGMPTLAEADAEPCSGSGYTCLQSASFPLGLSGIGMDKAAQIWFRATVMYLDNDPTFWEARQAWLKAAADLFGNPSPEHAAVQNAFYVINLGDAAQDVFPPELQAVPPIVDNYEGSVLVEASAVDDIGVVMIDVSIPGDSKKDFDGTFKEYLDAPAFPGSYEATVRAWDASLQSSTSNLPFDYTSSNRLFLSRFESAPANTWSMAIGEMLRSGDPDGAFLGQGYISFANNRWIEQDVEIPAEATQVQLGYRFRVKPGMGLGSGQLRVEILDDQDHVLETLTTITPATDTTQLFSHDYRKNTHVLSAPHAGESIKVRFRSIGSAYDLFRVDQVFMVYDATPTVGLTIDVDEREGSVIMDAEVAGVQHHLVDYVGFFVNGVQVAEDSYWPYQLIQSTEGYAKDVPLTAEAVVFDHFGNPIANSGDLDLEVQTVNQVLFNGDFEYGDDYWSVVGDVAWCNYNPAAGAGSPAFIGDGCESLSGTGSLSRTVWIPANALTASMSFRIDNDTPSMIGVDFAVQVVDNASGLVIGTLQNLSGVAANTDIGTTHKGYRKYVVDLTPYKGMDFSVRFDLQANGNPVFFRVDNVGAVYSIFEGGPGGGGPGGLGG